MIDVKDKSKCCGCSACVQICPKQCISFNEDEQGFRYPLVNIELCIGCGLCEKVCPEKHIGEKREPFAVWASINKNKDVRAVSSSGGIFSSLAEAVLDDGGVVFGARFDENWEVVHDYIESKEYIENFRRSKYVQSYIGETYKQVLGFLKKERKVLFTGSPCQIAGLKTYLRKDYDNLILVDFVCHGVPSPLVWRDYLEELTEHMQGTTDEGTSFLLFSKGKPIITGISFRNKLMGWNKYSFVIRGKSGSYMSSKTGALITDDEVLLHESFDVNPYLRAFLKNIILRESCFNCPFKRGRSGADITIADYWGVELFHPSFCDNKGVSLLMPYSVKGKSLIGKLDIISECSSYKKAIRCNSAIVQSPHPHPNRNLFFKDYHSKNSKIQWMKDCEKVTIYNKIFMNFLFIKDRLISKIRYIL